ncbi:hypothetical protein P4E94_10735 [Pontiellaceae bacterium B12219]|nr:hypothetical protein [Pontiellaceae bacterium B12219]
MNRFNYLFVFTVLLTTAQIAFAKRALQPMPETISSIQDLIQVLEETQRYIQPISPPSSEMYIEKKPIPYPVDWSGFDEKTTRYMTAYMDKYGLPRYELLIWEDLGTRERVITLGNTGYEVARIPAPNFYRPDFFYQGLLIKGASYTDEMRWIFDPAHSAVSVELIPDSLYATYQQNAVTEMASLAEPMALSFGPPMPDGSEEGTGALSNVIFSSTGNQIVSMSSDSNSVVSMLINIPTNFGGEHVEIFSKDNLLYSPGWDISKSWLPTFGNTNVAWTDPGSENKDVRYYIISDADADTDGDGYSNLRELIFETNGNGPGTFDFIDSDGDGMHDWYEIKLFGNLLQDGTDDYDHDDLKNNEEMVYNSNTASIVWNSDPSLADTDGDLMDDYLETVIYTFLNPLNPDDRDYDKDGLSNFQEHIGTTDLNNWDTDGDFFSDGWETKWNLSPHVPNDPASDIDLDGLALSNEYTYGTNPQEPDTDFDGTDDGAEINQGSSPTNPVDNGEAPDADDTVALYLSVGDSPLSGISDIFEIVVSGERTVRFHSGDFGNVENRWYTFKKGESYTVSVNHIVTKPEYFEIHGHLDPFYVAGIVGNGMLLDDPENVLTTDPGSYPNGNVPQYSEGKTATIHIPKVSLKLSTNIMTLKHNNECSLEVVTAPESILFTEHKIQIRRESGNTWYTLHNGENFDWTTKVAGEFDLRAVATARSERIIITEPAQAEVQFPEIEDIVLDSSVVPAMNLAWNLNKSGSDSQGFHEFGFMIYLNTLNNEYEIGSITPSTKFAWDDEDTGVLVLHEKWSDPTSPTPIASGVTYSVACFHTHPPITDAPEGFWRIVGPSGEDLTLHYSADTPGVVRDYIGVDHVVLPGHSKDDSDKLYHPLGPFQRGL